LISLRAGGVQHTIGKLKKKGHNFASNLISIEGLHTKLWASKIAGVPILKISKLPFGSPKTK